MFVLLKILLFFFRPLVWIVVLSLFALASRNKNLRQRLFVTAAVVLLVFSNPFIIRKLINWYEVAPTPMEKAGTYQAGIVLGGFVSYSLKEDKGYFNTSSDRFIETALLYKTGHIAKIIVAAGNGYIVKHNFREADFVKQRLTELGIPAADIYTDPDSRNTAENAIDAKRIVDSARLRGPFLLISSALHLPRAMRVFKKNGMQVVPFACDFISRGGGNNFFEDVLLPNSGALVVWDLYIKEIVGLTAYKLTGKG